MSGNILYEHTFISYLVNRGFYCKTYTIYIQLDITNSVVFGPSI